MNVNSKKIVEYTLHCINESKDETVILNELVEKFNIDKSLSETIYEMVLTGLFRAQIIHSGKVYPKSNIDNNEFLLEAIKLGTEQLKRSESK